MVYHSSKLSRSWTEIEGQSLCVLVSALGFIFMHGVDLCVHTQSCVEAAARLMTELGLKKRIKKKKAHLVILIST